MHQEHQPAEAPGLSLTVGKIGSIRDQQICCPDSLPAHLAKEVPPSLIEEICWLSRHRLPVRNRMYLIAGSEDQAMEIKVFRTWLHEIM